MAVTGRTMMACGVGATALALQTGCGPSVTWDGQWSRIDGDTWHSGALDIVHTADGQDLLTLRVTHGAADCEVEGHLSTSGTTATFQARDEDSRVVLEQLTRDRIEVHIEGVQSDGWCGPRAPRLAGTYVSGRPPPPLPSLANLADVPPGVDAVLHVLTGEAYRDVVWAFANPGAPSADGDVHIVRGRFEMGDAEGWIRWRDEGRHVVAVANAQGVHVWTDVRGERLPDDVVTLLDGTERWEGEPEVHHRPGPGITADDDLVVGVGSAPVRIGPSATAATLATARVGQEVVVSEVDGSFARIRVEDRSAWWFRGPPRVLDGFIDTAALAGRGESMDDAPDNLDGWARRRAHDPSVATALGYATAAREAGREAEADRVAAQADLLSRLALWDEDGLLLATLPAEALPWTPGAPLDDRPVAADELATLQPRLFGPDGQALDWWVLGPVGPAVPGTLGAVVARPHQAACASPQDAPTAWTLHATVKAPLPDGTVPALGIVGAQPAAWSREPPPTAASAESALDALAASLARRRAEVARDATMRWCGEDGRSPCRNIPTRQGPEVDGSIPFRGGHLVRACVSAVTGMPEPEGYAPPTCEAWVVRDEGDVAQMTTTLADDPVALRDVDGDGVPDLVATDLDAGPTCGGRVLMLGPWPDRAVLGDTTSTRCAVCK